MPVTEHRGNSHTLYTCHLLLPYLLLLLEPFQLESQVRYVLKMRQWVRTIDLKLFVELQPVEYPPTVSSAVPGVVNHPLPRGKLRRGYMFAVVG